MATDLLFFAKKLKVLRQKRHLTLEKLAELADLTPNHIAKLEAAKSNPSFNAISSLAKALNVELKELFNFDEFKDVNFVKTEFNEMIISAKEEHLKLLYKIYRDIVN